MSALLASGCFHPSLVGALPQTTILPDAQFQVRFKRLRSGMRILLDEARGSGRVAVMVGVNAGSADDPFGKEGLAHLVEHLTFRARPNDRLTINELHEFLGSSDHNGSTQFDLTTFQTFGVPGSLLGMVKIEISRLNAPLSGIDARVFDLEREVVRNELRLKHETGIAGEAVGALQAMLFPADHPCSRPVGGTMTSLAGLTLDDAKEFVAANYQPGNIVLVVAGDFDAAAVEGDVLKVLPPGYFQAASAQFEPREPEPVPDLPPRPAHPPVVHAGVDRTHLLLAWAVPPDNGGAELIALQSELQSALSRTWVDKDIGGATVLVLPGSHASMVVAAVALNLGMHPEDSLAEVRAGLHARFGPALAQAKLERFYHQGARPDLGMLLGEFVAAGDLMRRAQRRLEGACLANDPLAISRTLQGLASLDAPTRHELVGRWLTGERLRALVVEPLTAEPGAPPPAPIGVGLRPVNVQAPADEVRKLARGPLLTELKEFTLSNGLHVVAVRRPDLPMVSVALALPGGRARGAVGASELSRLFVPSAARRNEAAAGVHLLELARRSFADATLLQWDGAAGNLPNLLALARVFMTDSSLAEDEVKDPQGLLEHLEQQPEVRQAHDFDAMLYRGAQVGASMAVGDANAVLQGTARWAERVYLPGQSALAVVGDVQLEGLEEMAEKFLGEWRNDGVPLPLAVPPNEAGRPSQVLVNHRPKVRLVSLHLGCLAPSNGDRMRTTLLAALLKHRLDRLWRQQLGLTYGVGSGWFASSAGSSVHLFATLDARRLTSALRALKQEWEAEVLSAEELDRARWSLAAERTEAGSTIEGLASFLSLARLRGQSAREAVAAESTVADLPSSDVQAAFEVCRGSTVLRLDGDETVIRAALKAAGQ